MFTEKNIQSIRSITYLLVQTVSVRLVIWFYHPSLLQSQYLFWLARKCLSSLSTHLLLMKCMFKLNLHGDIEMGWMYYKLEAAL